MELRWRKHREARPSQASRPGKLGPFPAAGSPDSLRRVGRWATKPNTTSSRRAQAEASSTPDAPKPKKTTAPRKSATPKRTISTLPKLVAILESQKQLGAASYPPTLARLTELAGDPFQVTSKALTSTDAKSRVLLSRAAAAARKAPYATFVLLPEDLDATAHGDRLLECQLQTAHTDKNPAVDPAGLCKGLVPKLGTAFKAALQQRIAERRMPRGIGALPGKKTLFFFIADAVLPHAAAPARSHEERDGSGTTAAPFAARFDAAFHALNQASGRHNYVTLRALREALADVPRATFDAELTALRRQRLYSLDPSDGRHHQMTEAERNAGIMEAGNLLVYVARRDES